MHVRKAASIMSLTFVFIAGPALGQDANIAVPKQFSDLQNCRAVTDGGERLACYDRAVDTLTQATASREVMVVDRAEVRKTRKGLFGFTLPTIGFLSGKDDNEAEKEDAQELVTTVVNSRQLPLGTWRITVEGGGVWETVQVSRAFNDPKPGSPIRIEKGALGSYFAKVGKHGAVRARRIK